MAFEDLVVETEDQLRVVKLNRPEVLNALRSRTFMELREVLDEFAADPETRVLIVTGVDDRAFSAGGDIREMTQMTGRGAAQFARLGHAVLDKLERLPKPIVAAVNGFALGAGCDLAIACDLCVASERAVFGEPPPGIGSLTPFGGTQRLPRIIGPRWAKYLFFTGEHIDAKTAFRLGLVNKIVRHEDLMDATKKLVHRILSRAPIAVGFSKTLINASMTRTLEEGDKLEMELYAKCFDTRDRHEGMQAFLEKRTPVFRGE